VRKKDTMNVETGRRYGEEKIKKVISIRSQMKTTLKTLTLATLALLALSVSSQTNATATIEESDNNYLSLSGRTVDEMRAQALSNG
jgi:hypothetical protein